MLTHPVWWVEGTGSSLAAAPAPSLTVARASPPFLLAGLGGWDRRLDPSGAEGDPGAVVHGPGLGDQPGDLDRVALADARGHAWHLDGQDLGLALAQGDQLDDVERLAVLVGPWLLGVERQDRLRLQGAQERDRGRVDWELHAVLLRGCCRTAPI